MSQNNKIGIVSMIYYCLLLFSVLISSLHIPKLIVSNKCNELNIHVNIHLKAKENSDTNKCKFLLTMVQLYSHFSFHFIQKILDKKKNENKFEFIQLKVTEGWNTYRTYF